VQREAAYHHEPLVPPHLACTRGLARPFQRQLGGDHLRVPLLEIVDELQQQATLALELEAEGTTDLQVLVCCFVQRAHDFTSGQGSASVLRRSRSTRA
jgi:hypothetical protein